MGRPADRLGHSRYGPGGVRGGRALFWPTLFCFVVRVMSSRCLNVKDLSRSTGGSQSKGKDVAVHICGTVNALSCWTDIVTFDIVICKKKKKN